MTENMHPVESAMDSLIDLIDLIAMHTVGSGEMSEAFSREFWELVGTAFLDFNRDSEESITSLQFDLAIAAMNIAHDYGVYDLNGKLVSEPWNVQLSNSAWGMKGDEYCEAKIIYHWIEVMMDWTSKGYFNEPIEPIG